MVEIVNQELIFRTGLVATGPLVGKATATAIQPPGRWIHIGKGAVHHFRGRPAGDGAWANDGIFVLEQEVDNDYP